MENQPKKLNKALKISAIVGIIIVSLSIAYFLIIFLPKKQELTIRQNCADEAKTKAQKLLKDKMDMTENPAIKENYNEAIEKGLHLKADYESYYENCLSIKGLKK